MNVDRKVFLLLKQLNTHGLNNWELTDEEINKIQKQIYKIKGVQFE